MRRRHTRWALVTGVRRVLFRSGIGCVAFSPLGRGFLAGAGPVEPNDRRHKHPRFQPDAVAANSVRRAVVGRVAERLGATIAQVSLAWLLAKGVVPISGTRHVHDDRKSVV